MFITDPVPASLITARWCNSLYHEMMNGYRRAYVGADGVTSDSHEVSVGRQGPLEFT